MTRLLIALILMAVVEVYADDHAYEELIKKYGNAAKDNSKTETESVSESNSAAEKSAASRPAVKPVEVTETKVQTRSQMQKNAHEHIRVAAEKNTDKSQESQPHVEREMAATAEEPAPSGLLGNWGGAKKSLESKGITLDVAYTGDYVANLQGGLLKRDGYLGMGDVKFAFDVGSLFHSKGPSLNLRTFLAHGADPTSYVGDTFGSSSLQSTDTVRLYEAYLKHTVEDRFTIIAGLRDLNADFDTTSSAGYFINGSFGVNPTLSQTGVNGPSIYPTTALAVTVRFESTEHYYFQSGIFNAQAGNPEDPYGTHVNWSTNEGHLLIAETGFAPESASGPSKYAVGTWMYTKEQDATVTDKGPNSNWGYYGIVDQAISKTVSAFTKYGIAAPRLNKFSSDVEAGFVFTGLIPGRSKDKLGLGVSHAVVSDDYKTLNNTSVSETAYEMHYRSYLRDGLSIVPGYQYVVNPSIGATPKDASVGVLRIELAF